MNREKIRLEHMREHHHFLAYHWARVAEGLSPSEPMYRKAGMKSKYHARRERYFDNLIRSGTHGQ